MESGGTHRLAVNGATFLNLRPIRPISYERRARTRPQKSESPRRSLGQHYSKDRSMEGRPQWMAEKRRVLVVDDDQVDRQMVIRYLSEGFEVSEATNSQEALASVSKSAPDCILLDFDLGRENAIHLMPGLVKRGLAVVVYSGRGSETIAAMTYRLGGSDYLMKDRLSRDVLSRAIDKAICRSSVRRLVDQSLAYRKNQIEAAAPEDLEDPLEGLLIGEMGLYGEQVRIAQTHFLEIVDDIAGGVADQLDERVFTKSRILACGLGEMGVASSEVLHLLKQALICRSDRQDKTEMQLYVEACQAAALEIMAHLSDYYRDRERSERISASVLN